MKRCMVRVKVVPCAKWASKSDVASSGLYQGSPWSRPVCTRDHPGPVHFWMPVWQGAEPKMKRCMVSVKVVRTHPPTLNPFYMYHASASSSTSNLVNSDQLPTAHLTVALDRDRAPCQTS